ncbi:MAG: tRNA (adenosine(37)-N6)-threonylcarbamoyltransferase complex ATPase subunit type 1 TsaE [Gelidibacter sp.]|nr:tRNA (adenosine(37)-N6)-threonylcarbamoyltransferase complex ATPase subunit type 1 TsaE [Gelidibacter sp.]
MEITYQIGDIDNVAEVVIKELHSNIVLLIGEMGVGKTTFMKSFAKALGSTDEVTSPTFSIVNEYLTTNDKIYHFDMYRIKDEEEALQFGFEDYLYSNSWVVIEWPDRVANLIPNDVAIIDITQNNDASRTLKLSQNEILTQKPAYERCNMQ